MVRGDMKPDPSKSGFYIFNVRKQIKQMHVCTYICIWLANLHRGDLFHWDPDSEQKTLSPVVKKQKKRNGQESHCAVTSCILK